tara:strand:- start:335 stop:880 length:546 start_codon:yes stop_codon:yes gene_type:complete
MAKYRDREYWTVDSVRASKRPGIGIYKSQMNESYSDIRSRQSQEIEDLKWEYHDHYKEYQRKSKRVAKTDRQGRRRLAAEHRKYRTRMKREAAAIRKRAKADAARATKEWAASREVVTGLRKRKDKATKRKAIAQGRALGSGAAGSKTRAQSIGTSGRGRRRAVAGRGRRPGSGRSSRRPQ